MISEEAAACHRWIDTTKDLPPVTLIYGSGSAEDETYVRRVPGQQSSGTVVQQTLVDLGLQVDVTSPDADDLLQRLSSAHLVFINSHGDLGECGRIQAVLDLAKIPYTGSGVVASALALHKDLAKRVASSVGVAIPRGQVIGNLAEFDDAERILGYPMIAKPVRGGSSVGVTPLWSSESVSDLKAVAKRRGMLPLLIEEYVPGRDLTVGALIGERGIRCLPVLEVINEREPLYSEDAKMGAHWTGRIRYQVPALLQRSTVAYLHTVTSKFCRTLGLRGAVRLDFRLDSSGQVVFLEANTNPGLSRRSNLVLAADTSGLPFGDLIAWILWQAAYDDSLSGRPVYWRELIFAQTH